MSLLNQKKVDFAFNTSVFLIAGFLGLLFLVLSIVLNSSLFFIISLFCFIVGIGITFYLAFNKVELDKINEKIPKIKKKVPLKIKEEEKKEVWYIQEDLDQSKKTLDHNEEHYKKLNEDLDD